jgi:uncharacterized protein (TIGR03083 family)
MEPILVAHLLPAVDAKLVELLGSLSPEDWHRPTIVPGWQVRHVAAHLLDTSLRKLSLLRDGFAPDRPSGDFVQFINRLNAEGVAVYGRLSPQILIPLIAEASRQSNDFHGGLDPYASAAFGVSWAGESESLNWFDTARELTERWHHQQQIRLAVNQPGILTPELYHPVLDTFLRALPHQYRNVPARPGTTLHVQIAGACGGDWILQRTVENWQLIPSGASPSASITIPETIAWRIFTKGISRAEAETQITIAGDESLARPVLQTIAIVG